MNTTEWHCFYHVKCNVFMPLLKDELFCHLSTLLQKSKVLDKTEGQGHCKEEYKARTGTVFKRRAKIHWKGGKEFRGEKGLKGKVNLGAAIRSWGIWVTLRFLMYFIKVVLWSDLYFRISVMVCAWVGKNFLDMRQNIISETWYWEGNKAY